MDKKRASGRYYTRGNPFRLEPFQTWAQASNLAQQITLEPFAGAKDIPQLIDAANLQCQDWAFFDIQPGAEGIAQRDTLADFPKGFNVCITNPPWLARNSATRRGLPFPEATRYDDLYKYALEQCLTHCGWVAAIIPEAFIRSGLFLKRLHDFISLVPQTQDKTNYPPDKGGRGISVMFEDTEHPVGLALFAPDATSDVRIWRNNQLLGTMSELRRHLPQPSANRNIVFNDPAGNLGLIAIDNTVSASIRFCPPEELKDYPIRVHCRSITKIGVPWRVDIDMLNARLKTIREKTHDVFLTAFKGIRRDGHYRRRLDWALSRAIVDME
ncbi:hypothetical protein F4054_17765 [Candidatus Poribacteria bacterium]|nr:hypothetical protein [Candidatus Poribacteria bacterium]MYG06144.1 hypothetical protein [Candidatus Poribacteria bacterium]MYK24093.1 hypothetical protein [Candidatus Poribacteria bacterium]